MISAAQAPAIARWTPLASASRNRSSSSAMPTASTTAPAAISGPRCAGGRSSPARLATVQRLLRRAHLHGAVGHPHLHRGLRVGGRPALHGAVRETEPAAV